MALSKVRYTYPRFQMEYSRMFREFLTRHHTTEFPGPETKRNRGLSLSLENSRVPAMTAFISTTNAFFFVMILKVLCEPEHNALQIPLDHTEDCRGSVVSNGSHSAIRPIPCVH